VVSALGTGFLSMGLWVHHMYAVGIPQMSLAFFAAASTLVTVPSGIQVFALIGTAPASPSSARRSSSPAALSSSSCSAGSPA
jgi:heme/copper-type cytochrome/quinol oxidase subunit 1